MLSVSGSMLILMVAPLVVACSRLKVTPVSTSVMSLVSRVSATPSRVKIAGWAVCTTLVKSPELSVTPSLFMTSVPDTLLVTISALSEVAVSTSS